MFILSNLVNTAFNNGVGFPWLSAALFGLLVISDEFSDPFQFSAFYPSIDGGSVDAELLRYAFLRNAVLIKTPTNLYLRDRIIVRHGF